MNIPELELALNNNNNEGIINLSTNKITKIKYEILNELNLRQNDINTLLKKLQKYKYVDELNNLTYGGFIRWIPIIDPNNIRLNYCGIICEIKITDNGILINCKNFKHRHYTFKMDECLIFQKLTDQELILLHALDYLEKDIKTDTETETETDTDNYDTDTDYYDTDTDYYFK